MEKFVSFGLSFIDICFLLPSIWNFVLSALWVPWVIFWSHEPWHHGRFLKVLCCCQISTWVFCESQWVTRAGDWVSSHTSSRCRVLFWCFTRQTQSQKSKLRIYTTFNVSKEENQEFWKKLAKVFKFFNKDHVHWA